jgi:hypothetical protein
MDMLDSEPLTVAIAHRLLKQFDCLNSQSLELPETRDRLRQALKLVASQSDYQILGVCSGSFDQGRRSVESFARALGYTPRIELKPIAGAVYIKFNPKLGSCYIDTYTGDYRGVLVSCQSADESGLNQMYGHFPLDLFEESLSG